jgi:hypothetical protein
MRRKLNLFRGIRVACGQEKKESDVFLKKDEVLKKAREFAATNSKKI